MHVALRKLANTKKMSTPCATGSAGDKLSACSGALEGQFGEMGLYRGNLRTSGSIGAI